MFEKSFVGMWKGILIVGSPSAKSSSLISRLTSTRNQLGSLSLDGDRVTYTCFVSNNVGVQVLWSRCGHYYSTTNNVIVKCSDLVFIDGEKCSRRDSNRELIDLIRKNFAVDQVVEAFELGEYEKLLLLKNRILDFLGAPALDAVEAYIPEIQPNLPLFEAVRGTILEGKCHGSEMITSNNFSL